MIWKKQPVGSKLADLQNNKASKDTATQSAAGLMSAEDKTKLDGVETGATAVSVVNSLNSDSTTSALSAAQGKALNSKLTAYSGDTATAGTKFSVDSRVQRSGNLVFVSIIATANSTYGSSDIVANVPSGLRPTRSTPVLLITLYRGTSVYNYAVSGSVGTDGNIYQSYTSSNGQSGDRITMLFVYTI